MGGVFSSNSNNHLDAQIDRSLRIRRLEYEVESLKADNNELRREMMRELNRPAINRRGAAEEKLSEVSRLEVDRFVDGLLADPDTNMAAIPDFIEGPAQKTMLMFLLKAVAHAVDTSAIEFMGHEILLRMQPKHKGKPSEDAEPDEGEYGDYEDQDYSAQGSSYSTDRSINANGIPL